MVETVAFLVRVKLRAMFLASEVRWLNVLRLGAVVFSAAYGYYYGYLFDRMVTSDRVQVSIAQADILLQLLVLSMVVFVNYFPGYRPSGRFIRDTYPISRAVRLAANAAHDFIHLYYLYALVFLFAVKAGSLLFGWVACLTTLVLFAGALVGERAGKIFIEQEIRHRVGNLMVWSLVPVGLIAYAAMGYMGWWDEWRRLGLAAVWAGAAVWVYLRLDGAVTHTKDRRGVRPDRMRWDRRLPEELRIYLRRASIRPLLLILPLLKFVGVLYAYLVNGGQWHTMAWWTEYYAMLMFLPVAPFTYIQNNLAGFYRETWLAHDQAHGNAGRVGKAFYGVLWPVLGYDLLCTAVALQAIGVLEWNYLWLYAAVALGLVPVALWGSLWKPRRITHFLSIESLTSFQNNTSTRVTVVGMLVIVLLAGLWKAGVPGPILVLLTTSAWWGTTRRLKESYPEYRYRLYDRLFKQG